MLPEESPPAEQGVEQMLAELIGAKAAAAVKDFPIRWLVDAGQTELQLTKKQFARLKAGIELGRRIERLQATNDETHKLNSSKAAIEYCKQQFANLISDARQEYFNIVTLDTKNKPIGKHYVTKGTLDASLVHPREVFRPAIRDAASSVILVHNHPSGDPAPSREDLQVTDRLEEVGKTIGIEVLDHIIVARGGCISVREHRG